MIRSPLDTLAWARIATALWLVGLAPCAAQDTSQVRSPVSPRESLEHLVVPAGLKVELVAHEPDVIDPVAIRFDEDGRLWVVQMRDYPAASADGIQSGSRISVLRDTDNDGHFETATVFADDVRHATGVQPWNGGAFVTMAGQVVYMKDTNGDGRADLVEPWFTGFDDSNTQTLVNHPQLALDNHIYVSNGLRGGEVRDARDADSDPLSISGMDFRFDPITGSFAAVSGPGQFGATFDDYGNRFVCTNRNPVIHVVLRDHHLKKNPLYAAPSVTTDVADAGGASRLFPIARSWTTSHLHAGQFTAACGVKIYRGDALPRDCYGNVFVCEPTGHLVHRERMEPQGVSFAASAVHHRPQGEAGESDGPGREFFASRDEWCCPVNLEVGPDGALYIVDMYRAVIEHPEWIPTELRRRIDLTAGNDRGRIYRVVPADFIRPPTPQLSATPSESLVELLAHPNAWWRETAARLLLERQDKGVVPRLEQMARNHPSHLARIHAIWLLKGLDKLPNETVEQLLAESNPRVLEQAISAAEPRLAESSELRGRVSTFVGHDDARVRVAAMFAATPLPPPPKFPTDRWELDAMLVAAGTRGGTTLAAMLEQPAALKANIGDSTRFIADLARLAAASNDNGERAIAMNELLDSPAFGRAGLTAFFGEAARDGRSLEDLRSQLAANQRRELDRMVAQACDDAANEKLPPDARCEAIDFLAFSTDGSDALLAIALEEPVQSVRMRAVAALGKSQNLDLWRRLLGDFSRQTPAIRRAILDAVLASADRSRQLLEELAAARISPTELDANRMKLLLNHSETDIRSRAEELFANLLPADREQALADYRPVLEMTPDAAHGQAVFTKHCAACHRINGKGVAFAPDISDSREKSAEQLLTDIIQPNRAIDSNYFSYTVLTIDGLVHTGVLAAETSTSLTLRQAEGKSVTLRRDQIEELRSDGVSFMPDGLEKSIPPQDMADLIAYIKNWRYLASEQPSSSP